MSSNPDIINPDPRVLEVLRRVWGYEGLRPLQAEAIAAGLGGGMRWISRQSLYNVGNVG
jgi:superfamily II DNA helicase RecQ